ncbi:hypothetical protein GGX14DRAFT_396649 [Mycena pura]|uniref:Uncharacterized protein n=1 Tax=Mycena pura TaxID=153505 RepID=A0AAD6VHJ6_9AGAR|nr:hypothetical protein GGX14DRAFT_396649 [Mycena pura]
MSPLHRDPLLVATYAVLMLATTIALPYSVAFRYNAADPGTGALVEKETLRNRQGWQCRELPMLWCIQLSTEYSIWKPRFTEKPRSWEIFLFGSPDPRGFNSLIRIDGRMTQFN